MASMKLGGGGRFQALAASVEQREGVSKERADAIAASVGRKKFGAKRFQALAAKGRKAA